MSKIEQTKAYTGTEMEKLFFRPILSGPAAESLGIRVMGLMVKKRPVRGDKIA